MKHGIIDKDINSIEGSDTLVVKQSGAKREYYQNIMKQRLSKTPQSTPGSDTTPGDDSGTSGGDMAAERGDPSEAELERFPTNNKQEQILNRFMHLVLDSG